MWNVFRTYQLFYLHSLKNGIQERVLLTIQCTCHTVIPVQVASHLRSAIALLGFVVSTFRDLLARCQHLTTQHVSRIASVKAFLRLSFLLLSQ